MADEPIERTNMWPTSNRIFLQVEHGLYIALAVLLGATCLLALGGSAVTLWSGLVNWAETTTVFSVIERLLVVLMLIEILHTVMVSIRSGSLNCEPFLIVGLIASIRRILVITLESSQATQHGSMTEDVERVFRTSMIELGVLAVLILVMVASIYMLRLAKPQD